MARRLMALLAQQRRPAQQKRRIHGPMRCVAIQAIFLHGRMLPEEWPAKLRMTPVTGLIDSVCHEQIGAERAVRIVTGAAAERSCRHGVMRELLEIGAYSHMALVADTGLGRGEQYRIMSGVNRVAAYACKPLALMNAAVPSDSLGNVT